MTTVILTLKVILFCFNSALLSQSEMIMLYFLLYWYPHFCLKSSIGKEMIELTISVSSNNFWSFITWSDGKIFLIVRFIVYFIYSSTCLIFTFEMRVLNISFICIQGIKTMEKGFSIMSNLHSNCRLRPISKSGPTHRRHCTKQRNDNQLQSLKLPCRIS